MWFVVIVPKIENGGEGYEVRGWGVRGGRKSGQRVGGGMKSTLSGVLFYSCGNISAKYQPQYKFDDYRS